jgi:hypothetical protein
MTCSNGAVHDSLKGGCTPGDEKKASAIFVGGLLLSGLQLVPLNPTDPTAALKYSRYRT